MNLPPPLKLSFWFNVSPPPLMPVADWTFLILCCVCLALGIFAFIFLKAKRGLDKFKRRVIARTGSMLTTMGIFGLLLYAFLFQRIPYLSMRFWILIWIIGFGFWLWRVLNYAFVVIPTINRQRAEREQNEKWLPKKKN